MAVSTSFIPLGGAWVPLNVSATTPNTIMATGGPIQVIASSSGAPSAVSVGFLINPQMGLVTPFGFNTTTAYVLYAMAAARQTGVGVWVLVGG